ncbi:uncharacterized protein BXZ73DRAFT_85876, partial [Epithele typhae]|uniref:uncharacterized protein n=1 Tax=Epithele typhae TaxID=378194 RepID=UPI002007FCF8
MSIGLDIEDTGREGISKSNSDSHLSPVHSFLHVAQKPGRSKWKDVIVLIAVVVCSFQAGVFLSRLMYRSSPHERVVKPVRCGGSVDWNLVAGEDGMTRAVTTFPLDTSHLLEFMSDGDFSGCRFNFKVKHIDTAQSGHLRVEHEVHDLKPRIEDGGMAAMETCWVGGPERRWGIGFVCETYFEQAPRLNVTVNVELVIPWDVEPFHMRGFKTILPEFEQIYYVDTLRRVHHEYAQMTGENESVTAN